MRNSYRPLAPREQRHIVDFLGLLLPVAREDAHPMSALAKRQMSLTLWRWTADGVDKNGIVRQDALKYNTDLQAASYSAIKARRNGSGGLRHEHIVPRARLTREIITRNLRGEALHGFLSTFCKAVIITVGQDVKLQPRADMPKGWNCEGGNIYQRYIDAGLFDKIKMPAHIVQSR